MRTPSVLKKIRRFGQGFRQTIGRRIPDCSFGWWLMAGAGLFGEKSSAAWLLVAGLL
jgi:hypothetical protein